MQNILETFVINLKESKERLSRFDQNMKEQGITYTRWEATKGKDLSNHELKERVSFLCRNLLCSPGIIGCYLSHLEIWKHIASKNKEGWYMIFEDDAKIIEGFNENLEGVFEDLRKWDHKNRYPEVIHLSNDMNLFVKSSSTLYKTPVFNTMRGYMVSNVGARKLVSLMDRLVNYHIDMTITIKQMVWNSVSIYSSKSYVLSNDNFESTLGNHKTFPRLFPDIANFVIRAFNLSNSVHILYDSAVIGNYNLLITVFLLITSVLLAQKKYWAAAAYIFVEVAYYYARIS